jgi:hypothetical protein
LRFSRTPNDRSERPACSQEQPIYCGHASADAAVRAWLKQTYLPPACFLDLEIDA